MKLKIIPLLIISCFALTACNEDKKKEEEFKKIKLLKKKILLIQNIGNIVKVNGVTGMLNKVNDSIFEVENENEIFEIRIIVICQKKIHPRFDGTMLIAVVQKKNVKIHIFYDFFCAVNTVFTNANDETITKTFKQLHRFISNQFIIAVVVYNVVAFCDSSVTT